MSDGLLRGALLEGDQVGRGALDDAINLGLFEERFAVDEIGHSSGPRLCRLPL